MESIRKEAHASLVRMQCFEPESLAREKELGSALNFRAVVRPAAKLIELYKRLAPSALDDLPDYALQQLRDRANEDFSRFDQILKVAPTDANFQQQRPQFEQQVEQCYDSAFKLLHPFISYSLYKSTDFQRLEGEARSTLQAIRDNAEQITTDLAGQKEEAQGILADIRKVAAEHGVTQQAIYFGEASEKHEIDAESWRQSTMKWAGVLGLYAVMSLFLHKLVIVVSPYEAVQLAVSKVLIFGVISYVLYLSARNFLSHKHNGIVNKHRQNALMTYKALVDAADSTPNREVILTHAAACIFSPQPTGYTRAASPQAPSPRTVVELFGSALTPGGE